MKEIKCLDHGFVKLRNISGPVRRLDTEFDASDIDPAITARISFDNLDEVRSREQDLKLCEYLIKNYHTTPLEMVDIWLEMKLPIFVARQFVRHRTSCLNEVSARYVQLPAEWYIPEIVGGKSTTGAKQGQEDNVDLDVQEHFKYCLGRACREDYTLYEDFILEGVAPEHARLFLHVNHYTHWVWKQDLHNMLHFLRLRLHEHAQVEARVYAEAIYTLLKQYLPETMRLFDTYRREM